MHIDTDMRTTVARELLALSGQHDAETLAEALQTLVKVAATDGIGNAVSDLQDRVAETRRLGMHVSIAFDSPEELSHHSVVVWLVSTRLDLRAVADIVAGSHDVSTWTDALDRLHQWVEEES